MIITNNAPITDTKKADEAKVDVLEIDHDFCAGYFKRTGNPLDVVMVESARHLIWEGLLAQFDLDTLRHALTGFFATEDKWYSGRTGDVSMPFTPYLFRLWLKQRKHLRGTHTLPPVHVVTPQEAKEATANAIALCKRMGIDIKTKEE